MNRGWSLLAAVLLVLGLQGQASAQYRTPSWCYTPCDTPCCPTYCCPTYCCPTYCCPTYCCPTICCDPCCGTVVGGSVVVIVKGPSGVTDLKVKIAGKDAKPQAGVIFVSAETFDLTKEVDVMATGMVGGVAYTYTGKAKGNETVCIDLKKK